MIVAYTGIGSNDKVYFTEDQFLTIMREYIQFEDWNNVHPEERRIRLTFRDKILPEEFPLFSLQDWIDYSGAVRLEVEADEVLLERMNHNYNLAT